MKPSEPRADDDFQSAFHVEDTQVDLSGYGLVNAVTHFSQEPEDYDRATEFEAMGGKLIELSAPEWKGLAEAA